jgi:hypothetical protein
MLVQTTHGLTTYFHDDQFLASLAEKFSKQVEHPGQF